MRIDLPNVGPVLFIIFGIGIGVGVIWFQLFLSKKKNKLMGLILPVFFFLISLNTVLVFFASNTGSGERYKLIIMAIGFFLLYNIPTIVLLSINVFFKSKRNKQRALEKMSVQDLT